MNNKVDDSVAPYRARPRNLVLIILSISIALALLSSIRLLNTRAAGGLSVEILAAYNLVVDSNASSPSTYAPSVATVAGKFCNTNASGGDNLTNVFGYIGDFLAGTPGEYPETDSATFDTDHPLYGTGVYSFTHLGGSLGLADATRYIGTLEPGECNVQYWHLTYPQCSEGDRTPPCSGTPVWGDSVKPDDDLQISFDIWGEGDGSAADNKPWTMTTRNEISAMANKIEPNPNGRWFNTEDNTVQAGEIITSNGVLYDFGNVNKGFDNDGDGLFDYNAWAQPIGDANHDPSCFRLIRTTGVLTISRSGGKPPLILNFVDQLYFTDLPPDNTGVLGNIHYTFMNLAGPCLTSMTPYQEVASGSDNEKFNADFGTGIPGIRSSEPEVSISKNSPTTVGISTLFTYYIPFQNTSTEHSAGLTMDSGYPVNMPLVIHDTVPSGLIYEGGSAASGNTLPSGNGVEIRYSIDSGSTFTTTDPGNITSTLPNSQVVIQWWLTAPLGPTESGEVTFQATTPASPTSSFIENCTEISLDEADPFDEACTTTMIEGSNSIGDLVWKDDDGDGLYDSGDEDGLADISVNLYWDQDGDGELDDDDPLITSTVTSSSGAYLFDNLPDGNFLVRVDSDDPQIPYGHGLTTLGTLAVALDPTGASTDPVDYDQADFGFGPILQVDKTLMSGTPAYESDTVTFALALRNTRPGSSAEGDFCQYTLWTNTVHWDDTYTPPGGKNANARWLLTDNIRGAPDSFFAETNLTNNPQLVGLSGHNIGPQIGNITKVEYLAYVKEIQDLVALDTLNIRVWMTDTQRSEYSHTGGTYFTQTLGTVYEIRRDVTGDNPLGATKWEWGHFRDNTTEMQLEAVKQGGSNGNIGVDAAAYIITTDQTDCGGGDSTIATLPLTDTYDADLLQFLSADPAESSSTTSGTAPDQVGTLTWDNLGPLYAGETREITLTFKALDPGSTVYTTNTITVTNATFLSGREVNTATANADVQIIPAGLISGKVWSDVNGGTSGWYGSTGYDSGDSGIPDVTVRLYGCYSDDPANGGTLITDPTTTKTCDAQSPSADWFAVPGGVTVTDENGDYIFEGLLEGYYYVEVDSSTLPSGASQSAEPIPNHANNGADCGNCNHIWEPSGAVGSYATADLNSTNFNPIVGNEHITDVNFGYGSVPNQIFGTVYHDKNGDGDQDVGEAGFSSPVTVQLWDCVDGTCGNGDDVISTTTTTDAAGYYSFDNVANGDYFVKVIPPADTTQTDDPDGACPGVDCDHQSSLSTPITLDGGEISGPYDFGYYQTGEADIGGTLYKDWNGDADQDSGETGITSVTVMLYEDSDGDGALDLSSDAFISTTVTDSSGDYAFYDVVTGTYFIVVQTNDSDFPSGWPQTEDPDSSVDSVASRVVISETLVIDIGGSPWTEGNTDIDFGYQPTGTGSIGDFVWQDDDADGIQDSGEPGIENILLTLYVDNNNNGVVDSGDAFVLTTTTNVSGTYLFDDLPAATYLVDVDETDGDLPTDAFDNRFVLSTDDGSSANGLDNDPLKVVLADDQDYTQADFGFARGATVGDTIWQDNDGDGQIGDGEPGISGVTVNLYVDVLEDGDYDPGTDTLYTSVTTNVSGTYTITSVPAGYYVVVVDETPLGSYTQTYDPDATSVPCSGGECNAESGVTLKAGQVDYSKDFGYQPPNAVGDFIWYDADKDGEQDPGEQGIQGVTVELYVDVNENGRYDDGTDTLYADATTNSDGYYSLGGMPNDKYIVVVDTSTLPWPTMTQSGDPDQPDTPCTDCDNESGVTLSGTHDMTRDFGYYFDGSNTLSGTIFFDRGDLGDPYQLGTDSPIGNVTVYLYDSSGVLVATDVVTGNGVYSFTNLLVSESYTVTVDIKSPQLSGLTMTYEPDLGPSGQCAGTCDHKWGVTFGPDGDQTETGDFGFYADMDCGDLPISYNNNPIGYRTTLSNEGPCHVNKSGNPTPDHYMGSAWDADTDGQPDSSATGDDNDSVEDDEDGITYPDVTTWNPESTVQIQATAEGSNAYLAGWFDWNSDGDFVNPSGQYDTGEYIFFGQVAVGSQWLNVSIPAISGCSAAPCFTETEPLYTRFRLYKGSSPPPIVAPSGNVDNGEVEDYRWPAGPTAVTMAGYGATAEIGQVRLHWETALELDAIGFNLYRATDPVGLREQINPELIPSKALGGVMGASYEFIDQDVEPGVTYYYWLEFIDLFGKEIFGPMAVSPLQGLYFPLVTR